MVSIKSLSLLLTIWLESTVTTVAASVDARSDPAGRPLTPRTDAGVCGTGIYQELSPILKGYPIAVDFCWAAFPVKCGSGKKKRGIATTTAAAVTTTKTTAKPDKTKSAWNKCQQQPLKVISTLCSCIQTKCKSTTTKKTTTKSTTPVLTTPVLTTPVITTPATTPMTTPMTTESTTTTTTTALVPCQDCEGTGCPGCGAICRNGSCQFD